LKAATIDPPNNKNMSPSQDPPASTLIEVEQKFRLNDPAAYERQLIRMGAVSGPIQRHADTYYRHPARDFAATREALRIRRVITLINPSDPDGAETCETLVTYKGPYLTTGVKARPELEWGLEPSDPKGERMAALLGHLGFSESLTVRKTRKSFFLQRCGREMAVTIDDAEHLGTFTEIETLADDRPLIEECRALITEMAAQLGLQQPEPRSYLAMALQAVANR
jgi:adenylate cyclase class 2